MVGAYHMPTFVPFLNQWASCPNFKICACKYKHWNHRYKIYHLALNICIEGGGIFSCSFIQMLQSKWLQVQAEMGHNFSSGTITSTPHHSETFSVRWPAYLPYVVVRHCCVDCDCKFSNIEVANQVCQNQSKTQSKLRAAQVLFKLVFQTPWTPPWHFLNSECALNFCLWIKFWYHRLGLEQMYSKPILILAWQKSWYWHKQQICI
jgi:hypothetical protein